eukprot:scaffold6463_cov66-Cylindrotheca_fusiformis.AAC.1
MQHETEDVWVYAGQRRPSTWVYMRLRRVASLLLRGEVPATVRRVLIAENVTRIRWKAFEEHQELAEVTISSSVQVIGKFAFRGCKKLRFIFHHEDLGQEKELGTPSNVR